MGGRLRGGEKIREFSLPPNRLENGQPPDEFNFFAGVLTGRRFWGRFVEWKEGVLASWGGLVGLRV
jgi:hypothetical protein